MHGDKTSRDLCCTKKVKLLSEDVRMDSQIHITVEILLLNSDLRIPKEDQRVSLLL